MPIRRKSSPVDAQCIWDVIKYLTVNKITPEHNRVIKKLIDLNGPSQWTNIINKLIEDNLLEIVPKRGEETVPTYKIPTAESPVLDGRDWYCFECHSGGNVDFCSNQLCPRVFHSECVEKAAVEKFSLIQNIFNNIDSTLILKKGIGLPSRRISSVAVTDGGGIVDPHKSNSEQNVVYNKSLCLLCNMTKLKNFSLRNTELNHLLRFILIRIRSWIPTNIAHKLDENNSPSWLTNDDLAWRINYLIYEHIDMSVIEFKIDNDIYNNCHSILMDVLGISHNIGILHGVDSQEYLASQFVLRDTLHDLGEIICCPDCFKHSNEKVSINWFAIPCKQPHEIVWAKQKGYSYWPSKVIKRIDNQLDVRYFGSKHERAMLSDQCIQPIDTPREILKLKKSVTLTKAIEEMELHQKLVENPIALEIFISAQRQTSTPNARTSAPTIPKRSKTPKPPSTVKSAPSTAVKKVVNKKTRGSISKSGLKNEKETYSTPRRKVSQAKKETDSSPKKKVSPAKKETVTSPKKKVTPANKVKKIPETSFKVPTSPRKSRKRKSDDVNEVVVQVPQGSKSDRSINKEPSPKKKKVSAKKSTSPKKTSKQTKKATSSSINDIINLSDTDEEAIASSSGLTADRGLTSNYEQLHLVTSSTEVRNQEMLELYQPYSDEVELMKRTLENISNKKEIIKCAMKFMQREVDRITEKHKQHLVTLFETHNNHISETKKKQWCYNCEQDAIYHCCWNTAYCSTICQQQHWQAEHKKVCRRKR